MNVLKYLYAIPLLLMFINEAVAYPASKSAGPRVNSPSAHTVTKTSESTVPHPTLPGAAGVQQGYEIVVREAAPLNATLTHTIDRAAAATAAAALLKFAGPVAGITNAISLGMLIYDSSLQMWVKPPEGFDWNQDGYQEGVFWSTQYSSNYYATGIEACQSFTNSAAIYDSFRPGDMSDNKGDCRYYHVANQTHVWTENRVIRGYCSQTTPQAVPICLNNNPMPENQPATLADIEQAVNDGIGTDSNKAAAVAEAAKQGGYEPDASGTPAASGPPQVQGPTSQTIQNTTEGSYTINENTVYNITYEGDTITVIEETTKTTTKPDGSTETETTTTTPPQGGEQQGGEGIPIDFPNDYATESTSNLILEAIQGLKGAFDSVTNAITAIYDWLMQPVPQEPLPALPEPPIEAVEPPGLITDLNSYLTDLDETAACAPDYTISILGASVVLPMQPFCDLADLARPLNQIFFIIFAMLAFFRIYAR